MSTQELWLIIDKNSLFDSLQAMRTRISIREYRPSDKKSIVALIQCLQDHVAMLDPLKLNKHGPAFLAAKYVEYLLDRVSKENGAVFVAEHHGEMVGCIGGVVQEGPEDLETYRTLNGRIMDLVVSPEHRGNAIGKKLMLAMEQHFQKFHCRFTRVACFGYNRDAHRFYEKCGYHDRAVEMIKAL